MERTLPVTIPSKTISDLPDESRRPKSQMPPLASSFRLFILRSMKSLRPSRRAFAADALVGMKRCALLRMKGFHASRRIAGKIGLKDFYPGPGHTRDNIVIYYAPAKVLFGGCLIRPGGATDLGNTADGDVANWADAAREVAAEFPDAEIVIPSHGPPGGRELLDHAIALAEAAAGAD